MKMRFRFLRLLFCLGLCGCSQDHRIAAETGTWRASNDHGDKPGNGIELRVGKTGEFQGRFFLLRPEKPNDFLAGVSLPMAISQHSANEVLFSVDFGNGQIDHMRLSFPHRITGNTCEGVLQDQGGGDAPIRFVFHKL